MALLRLVSQGGGSLDLEYNASNGRASRLVCTIPTGISGKVVLTSGQTITGSLRAGQSVPVPGAQVRVVPDGLGGMEITGVVSITFHRGIG